MPKQITILALFMLYLIPVGYAGPFSSCATLFSKLLNKTKSQPAILNSNKQTELPIKVHEHGTRLDDHNSLAENARRTSVADNAADLGNKFRDRSRFVDALNTLDPNGTILISDDFGQRAFLVSELLAANQNPNQTTFNWNNNFVSRPKSVQYIPARIELCSNPLLLDGQANEIRKIFNGEIAKDLYYPIAIEPFIRNDNSIDAIITVKDLEGGNHYTYLHSETAEQKQLEPEFKMIRSGGGVTLQWANKLSEKFDMDQSDALALLGPRLDPKDNTLSHLGLIRNSEDGKLTLNSKHGVLPTYNEFLPKIETGKLTATVLSQMYKSLFPDQSPPEDSKFEELAKSLNSLPNYSQLGRVYLGLARENSIKHLDGIYGNQVFGLLLGQILVKKMTGSVVKLNSPDLAFLSNFHMDQVNLVPSAYSMGKVTPVPLTEAKLPVHYHYVDVLPENNDLGSYYFEHLYKHSGKLPEIAKVNRPKKETQVKDSNSLPNINVNGTPVKTAQLPAAAKTTSANVLYYGEAYRMGDDTVRFRFQNGRQAKKNANNDINRHIDAHRMDLDNLNPETSENSAFLPTSERRETAANFAVMKNDIGIVYLIDPKQANVLNTVELFNNYPIGSPKLQVHLRNEKEIDFMGSISPRRFIAAVHLDKGKPIKIEMNPNYVPQSETINDQTAKLNSSPTEEVLTTDKQSAIPSQFEHDLAKASGLSLSETIAILRNFSTTNTLTGETSVYKKKGKLTFKPDKNLIGAYRAFKDHKTFTESDLNSLRKIAFSEHLDGKREKRVPHFQKNIESTVEFKANIHPEVLERIKRHGYNIEVAKSTLNASGGSLYKLTQTPEQISKALSQFAIDLESLQNSGASPEKVAAFAVQELLIIHPWKNGNGRTARLLGQILYYQMTGKSIIFPIEFHYELEHSLDNLAKVLEGLKKN